MMIATEMDMDAKHILSNKKCFLDGKMKRCKNFVTLTASVYHPMWQKQLPLGTRECISEDSANIGRFWNNFSKAFKNVTKTDKKFSPIRWITDMATANFNDLQWSTVKMYYIKLKDVSFIYANQSTTMRQNVVIRSVLRYFIQIVFHEFYWVTLCRWVPSNFVML